MDSTFLSFNPIIQRLSGGKLMYSTLSAWMLRVHSPSQLIVLVRDALWVCK